VKCTVKQPQAEGITLTWESEPTPTSDTELNDPLMAFAA